MEKIETLGNIPEELKKSREELNKILDLSESIDLSEVLLEDAKNFIVFLGELFSSDASLKSDLKNGWKFVIQRMNSSAILIEGEIAKYLLKTNTGKIKKTIL